MSGLLLVKTNSSTGKDPDMTHPEPHTAIQAALESLVEEGFDGMATAMQILFNEAMKIERSQFLRAEPHERTSEREGYANGFKPKSVKSRIGRLDLRIPQVRDTETPFYPRSLERGLRSERALKLAIAEMYVQGVSTRKVKEIVEQLCGTGINSTEVSRAAKLLDEELSAWRERELGAIKYLILDARYEKFRYAGSVYITNEDGGQACGDSQKGGCLITQRDRVARKLRELRMEARRRMDQPVPQQQCWLSQALRGHYAYFGLSGNWRAVSNLYWQVLTLWGRSLRRRSQRGLTWAHFAELLTRFPLPRPRMNPSWIDRLAAIG